MYLLDTNIWLERLLDQVPTDQLLITDFSFHSIGVVLSRLRRVEELLRFVQDVLLDGEVSLASLEPSEMQRLVEVMDTFNLDFDDAYQYVATEKYAAILVSFDEDFNRTKYGKKTPAEVLGSE